MTDIPQHVRDAAGTLIVFMLGQGIDVEGGGFIELNRISIGPIPNDTPLGSWRIEIRRTARPGSSETEKDL
jgi:hypothetical protein